MAETKILFASDLHGSETFFEKILSVAKSYSVNVLLISGDLTGKAIIPIVKLETGMYVTNFFGRDKVLRRASIRRHTHIKNDEWMAIPVPRLYLSLASCF